MVGGRSWVGAEPVTGAGACEGRRPRSQAPLLQAFDDFIFAFFAVEMVIKMIALGLFGQKCYLGDTWNRLDFFIVMAGYGPSPRGPAWSDPGAWSGPSGSGPGGPRMRDGEVHSGGTGPRECLGWGARGGTYPGSLCQHQGRWGIHEVSRAACERRGSSSAEPRLCFPYLWAAGLGARHGDHVSSKCSPPGLSHQGTLERAGCPLA